VTLNELERCNGRYATFVSKCAVHQNNYYHAVTGEKLFDQ